MIAVLASGWDVRSDPVAVVVLVVALGLTFGTSIAVLLFGGAGASDPAEHRAAAAHRPRAGRHTDLVASAESGRNPTVTELLAPLAEVDDRGIRCAFCCTSGSPGNIRPQHHCKADYHARLRGADSYQPLRKDCTC